MSPPAPPPTVGDSLRLRVMMMEILPVTSVVQIQVVPVSAVCHRVIVIILLTFTNFVYKSIKSEIYTGNDQTRLFDDILQL